MAESRVLSNIPYTIHNNSNYDIIAEETRTVIDVPYFPAQNIVDVSKKLNPYNPQVDGYIPFYDKNNKHRLYGLINRPDARFVFIELADDARYVQYKFSGNAYPQSRDTYGYSYDGKNLYILGGYANGRCLNDLWKYNIDTNTWVNANISFIEKGSNQLPSRRRKSNILATQDEIMLFGGETDALTINTADIVEFIVPLNDLWSYNLSNNTWVNYDVNRALPHRQGHIIYNTPTETKIYIIGGTNEIGVVEPNAIWTVNKITGAINSTPVTAPFLPAHNNYCLLIDGNVHVFLNNGSVYKWDNTASQFVLIRTNIAAINPIDGFYWTVVQTTVNYGANIGMGSTKVSVATLYNTSAASQSIKTITLPPVGIDIPFVNIDNVQTFFYGGMYNSAGTNTFNESTYIMNHTTLLVQKFDFDASARPTERVFPSLAYDSYNGRVWLFGGFDGTKFYNDLWYFDLGLKTWVKVRDQVEDTTAVYPKPRHKAGLAIVDTHYLYLIGGYSDANSYNDFWRYNVTTDTWERVYTADNIPWGSQYAIFQWRDRLWMFNGQQLYRYFFDLKQFIAQPFLMEDDSTFNTWYRNPEDSLFALIKDKKYMNPPVRVTCVGDHMMVQNGELLFDVDLDTKIVLNLTTEFQIVEQLYWLDRHVAIGTSSMAAYYINISAMQPLTKNQIPHSRYHRDLYSPQPDCALFVDGYTNKTMYQDKSGIFTIQDQLLPIDKATLLYDNEISYTGLQSQLTEVNFNDSLEVYNKTIEVLSQPSTYPVSPWFLYSKYKSPTSVYEGSQTVIYNKDQNRVYVLYKDGTVLKVNADDNTFIKYQTKLWEGAAFGYHKLHNKIYAFGGIRNTRKVYQQNGLESLSVHTKTTEEKTHNGLMQFDLNVNAMNLNSIEHYQKEKNVSLVDYPLTRDYLISLISKYIEGYADNTIQNSIEEVKDQIYLATQPIVDDLSQFDYVFENGTRPLGRAFSAYAQVGNKLYIFGGAECYTSDCASIQYPSPYNTAQPGTIANSARVENNNDPIYITQSEGLKAVCFDMDTHTWTTLESMPEWRYMASTIVDKNDRYIYIVGGFTGANCTSPSNEIIVYDVLYDTYEKIKGVPSTYKGRALPILQWIDENKLMIMYGFSTYNKISECAGCVCKTYNHIPREDVWIYDNRSNVMYKVFKDIDVQAAIVAKDSFYTDDEKENTVYSMAIAPDVDAENNVVIKANKWNLVTGTITPFSIKPSSEIIADYDAFSHHTINSTIDLLTSSLDETGVITLSDVYDSKFTKMNYRFRYCWTEPYGVSGSKHLFIIGEKSEQSGITHLSNASSGYEEVDLRFWYVNLEAPDDTRVMQNISYEYPLPLSPVVLAYDGSRYVYAIYNKYNIWRLDFKGMLLDNSGSYWYQCPPCLDCNFLGDSRTNSTNADDPWNAFFTKPNYLTLVSSKGRIARMDTNTFVWYFDKETPPTPPSINAKLIAGSETENNEIYLYDLGGISGKVLNIYEKQWDNFFLDMRNTSALVNNYQNVIDPKMWPTFLRRRKLFTMNSLGHLFYTWLRIDGEYDVEFQLQDFYEGNEIRIYGDYNLIQNKNSIELQVFGINSGWITIDKNSFVSVINELGWDWDGDYARRYVHVFTDATGNVVQDYSELPPNYVSVDLNTTISSEPISKIRVYYKNTPSDFNYMSRINKVELISTQTVVNAYDTELGVNPLSIVHIEPITVNDTFSNQFAVYIKNTGDTPVTNVVIYSYDNDWIQFNLSPSVTPDAWTIRDHTNPFNVTNNIDPGTSAVVYIRAVNIDSRPHTKDLVVKGVYAFT